MSDIRLMLTMLKRVGISLLAGGIAMIAGYQIIFQILSFEVGHAASVMDNLVWARSSVQAIWRL